ncbi:MAG: DUF763 domain-containing protein [Candidatus Omnitrophica bacterium]|nr:DUF763 domain-containing protein [Candidatus Omnitrophota bacterium]
MNKTGIAQLPLHTGKAPKWLFERMRLLARETALFIVREQGQSEFLNKISDPFWFQAFGCVLGFDWHSSGVTTTVCGALKEAMKDMQNEIGIFVCGGKGSASRKTPDEIADIGQRLSLEVKDLIYASRLSAKVDNTALQDGYQLYHHSFIFTKKLEWAVIQQGMNKENSYARRYHWLSSGLDDFVCEPHSAICCDKQGLTLNMVAEESKGARDASTELSRVKPGNIIREIKKIQNLKLPKQHEILIRDINPDRLNRIFLKTYETQASNFETLLGIEGVGPKTIRALALISELVYGKKPSFNDPARFSFAHGGKDGYPYPVNRQSYDNSINIIRDALNKARLGYTDRIYAIKRLNRLEVAIGV